jgi:hypothetical protein
VTIRRLILAKQRPDAPGEADARRKHIAAGIQAHTEAIAKFGSVTAENAVEFIRFQEQRMKELQ